jgi:hypothetical protein
MMSSDSFRPLRASTAFATALALMVMTMPARADEPVFPPGSRVGLVPPPGMIASNTFDGFADPSKDAAILITVLPAAAYPQMDKTLDIDTLKKQGVSLDKREPMQVSFGKGFLLVGHQTADKMRYKKWLLVAGASDLTALVTVQVPEQESKTYPDNVVRAALASLAVRAKVPEAEELGLLPFAVGDFAGFQVEDVLRGRALMLRDTPGAKDAGKDTSKDAGGGSFDARMLIAALPGGPAEPDGRANFARVTFQEIGGIRDVTVTLSEPLRIAGQSGYQTMADAKDARTGTDVRVIQWLRFGGGGYLQMVGIASADTWTGVLARLRTVRDSVELK